MTSGHLRVGEAVDELERQSGPGSPTPDRLRVPANRESLVETVYAHDTSEGKAADTVDVDRAQHLPSRPVPINDDNAEELELDDLKRTHTSNPSPKGILTTTLLRNDIEDDTYMISLPPPPPFDLEIDDLTIGVPSSSGGIPLLGRLFPKQASEDDAALPNTIVKNVSAICSSGEMLAMWVV